MKLSKLMLIVLILLSFASLLDAQNTRAVAPLIQPVWHQTDPWNARCPGFGANKAHAGSHALAMAKIMKYWAYPTFGVGTVTYTDDDYGVLTQDMSATINWDGMSNDLIFQTTQRWIFKSGVACLTDYEVDYSTSTLANVQFALLNSFMYNTSITYRTREGNSNFYWKSLIRTELDNNRPVIYSAVLADGNEVAFLIDGYDDDGLFHINWSDNNVPNSYVDLNVLTVHGETISAANQHMLTGIKPSDGPANVDESFETDFSNFNWQFSGQSNWTISSESSYFGTQSAKSGNINDNQITSMFIQINVTNPDTISFYKRVSCEAETNNLYDHMTFFIDNVEQERWSGNGSWGYHEYPVTPGVHEFRWTYSKDGATDYYNDCAWVDGIDFPEGSTPLNPVRFVEAEVFETNNIQVNWVVPEGVLIDLQGYKVFRNGVQIVQYNNPLMTSHVDFDMPNGDYTYYVRAVYQQGVAGLSNIAPVTVEVPYAPVNLTGALVGVNNVELTWEAPPLLRDRAMMGYQIYRDNVLIAQVENPEALNWQDIGLSEGVYFYQVTAMYSVGESARSNTAQVAVGVPDPPANFHATVSGDDVTLTWNQVPDTTFLQGFKIFRNGTMVHQITSPTQLQYVDQNLLNATYSYYIKAVYVGEDSGNSAVVTVTVEVPYPPANPTATVVNGINVQVRWTNPQATRTLTQYRVYRDGELIAAIFNPNIYLYLDQDLPNATYTYTLTAIYSGIESPHSVPVSVLVEVLYPPTNLTANVSLAEVQLNWTVPVNSGGLRSFNGYNVYRNDVLVHYVSGGTNHSYRDMSVPNGLYRYDVKAVYTTGESTPATVSNVLVEILYPPTNLTYSTNDDDVTLNWTAAATSPSTRDTATRAFQNYNIYRENVLIAQTTNTTYTDVNLTNGFYHYYVKALYGTGESIATNTVSLELEVPYPPRNLAAVVTGDDVSLSWTAPATSGGLSRTFVNYQVYRDGNLLFTTTALTYNDNNLANATYQYYVKAVYQHSVSAPSNIATALVEVPYPARSLQYVVLNRNNVTLNWTAPLTSGGLRNLTGYQIFRNDVLLTTITGRIYTDATLPDGNYTYYVRAVYGTGIAQPSNSVTARIEYPYPPANVATSVNADDVTITWNAVPGTTIGYKLYRNNVLLTTVTGLSYTDANLANGVYQYYLISYNSSDSGLSDPSLTVSATVEVLYPPRTLTYNVVGDDVTLNWLAPLTSGGLRNLTGYSVYKDNVLLGQTAALTWSDLNLTNGIYHYNVVANYSNGNSLPGNTVTVLIEVLYPATALTYSVNADAVTLNWTAAVASGGLRNLQGYRIYRNGSMINQVTGTTYLDAGLSNGVFTYYVVAIYGTGVSTPSNSVTATVELLYPPSNLTYAFNDDAVVLSWAAAPISGGLRNFIGYKVYRDNVLLTQVTSVTYTDNGLANGFYDYKVTALYSSGESSPTNIVHVEVQVRYPARNLTTSVNIDDVTLNWMAPVNTGGLRSFTGYKVLRNGALLTTTTALTYLDANLPNGLYAYQIVATYQSGDAAPTPAVNALVEVLFPAANLTYSVDTDAVTLNWTAAATSARGFIGYKVYRNGSFIAETTNLTYTNQPLANGVYTYYVTAHYSTGESTPTNTVTVTVDVLYPATNLTCSVLNDDVTLNWNAAATSEGMRSLIGYSVYRDNVLLSQTPALTYADLNLANGSYQYRIIANYTNGNSNPSNIATAIVEVLYPATALTYSVNADAVTLNWTAAAVSGGLRNFQGYNIYRNGSVITQVTGTTYLDAGLTNGIYAYYVVAVYGTGVSTPSNTVTATVEVLYPPSNLTYSQDDDAVTLNWNAAPISGGLRSFLGYQVYRNNVLLTQVTGLTFTDNALTNGFYDYKVTALYTAGESTPTNTVHVEVEVHYPATGLTYSVNADDVTLNWTAAAISGGLRSFTGYKVYRDNVLLTTVTGLTYQDSNLPNGIYNYHIIAAYQGGDSAPTPDVSVLVEVLYPASALTYSVNADAVTLNWNAAPTAARGFIGYKVYRDNVQITETTALTYTDPALANGIYDYYVVAHYGTGDSTPTNTVTATVEVLYPASALTYTVTDDDVALHWTAAATSGGLRSFLGYAIYRDNVQIGLTPTLTYNDLNLTNGTYSYYVVATYTSGNSTPTNTVNVLVEVLYPATALTYNVNADAVTLNWTAAAVSGGLRNFQGYNIYRNDSLLTQVTGTTYLDAGLTNGIYAYYVVAVYGTGVSTPSNTVTATVEVLYPPSNLTYSQDDDAVTLNWNAAPTSGGLRSFLGYQVYRNNVQLTQVTGLTFTDNALTNGFYDYKVTALYTAGESTPTNTVHVEVEVHYPATGLTYSVNADDVTLNWTAAAISGGLRSFAGYKVYRDNVLLTTVTGLTYLDANLPNGIYNYHIIAAYQGGDSAPTPDVSVLVEVLYPATALTYSVNADAVTLNWNAAPTAARGFIGYKVYRNNVQITETTALTYTDPALANGIYDYYVVAHYGTGDSTPTNTVTATVEVLYPASALTYTVTDDDVALHWTAAATSGGLRSFLGYAIYRDNVQIGLTPTLTYNDLNLTNGTYSYYVVATYTSGNSTPTNIVNVLVEVLYPATALTYSVNADAVTLNWTAAAVSGGSRALNGYSVYQNGTLLGQTTNPTYHVTGLANGIYSYYVIANYGTGNSAASNTVTLTIEVLYPATNLTSLVSGDDVTLNWAAVANSPNGLIGYRVYRNYALIATITDPHYLDLNLSNAVYDYYVTAVYNAGESISTNVVRLTVEVLYPVALLTAAVSEDNVTLNWTLPATSPTRAFNGYFIYRNSVLYDVINSSTATTWTDLGLANGDYAYSLTAVYDAGLSITSNVVNVTVFVMPSLNPPTGLSATVTNVRDVNLTWNVPIGAVQSYKIYRNNVQVAEVTTPAWTDLSLPNGSFDYYVKAQYAAGLSSASNTITANIMVANAPAGFAAQIQMGNHVRLTWLPPNLGELGYIIYRNGAEVAYLSDPTATHYVDSGLPNGLVSYYMKAVYLNVISIPTPTVSVTITQAYNPYNLATVVTTSQVSLTWSQPTDMGGFLSYNIYKDGSAYSASLVPSFTDVNVSNGSHSYYVTALFTTGESFPSNTSMASVQVAYAPTGLSAVVNARNVSLSWNAASDLGGFTAYRIWRNNTLIGSSTVTSYQDISLVNADYQYYVTAEYGFGISAASNLETARILQTYAPQTATATAVANTAQLVWTAPADLGFLTGYRVYRGAVQIAQTTGFTYTDPALANNNYSYSVTAMYGAYESAATGTGDLHIEQIYLPSSPVVNVSNDSVQFSWTAVSDPGFLINYKVYRNNVLIGSTSGLTYSQSNLANGSYTYQVAALYGAGESAHTTGVTANVELPYAVTGLNYAVNGGDVQLRWVAPVNSGGLRNLIGYQVFRNNVQITETLNLNYLDTSLPNGNHTYTVKAHYTSGISAASTSVTAMVERAFAPVLTSIDTIQNQVTLHWNAPADTTFLVGYKVFKNDVGIARTTAHSFVNYFVPNGSHSYKVSAIYAHGHAAFSATQVATVTVAFAPRNLAAVVTGNNVALTWSAPAQTEGFTSYKVYRNGVLQTTQTTLTYADISLPNADYTYRVTTMYGANESISAATTVASVAVTYPATNVVAVFEPGTANAVITWNAPQGGPTFNGYNVYFLLDTQQNNPTSWISVAQGITNLNALDLFHGGLPQGSFVWAVIANYDNGNSVAAFSNVLTYTGTEDDEQIAVTQLKGNYPNPFNPETRIAFSLKTAMQTQLLIYNSKGQLVRTLINETLKAGEHTITWKGDNDQKQPQSSGIYFYRLITPDYAKTGKAVMMK